LAHAGGELLTRPLDLGGALGSLDLSGVLGGGERDTEGQNHRQGQSNQPGSHNVLLVLLAIVGPIPECTAARRTTRCIYSSRVGLDISRDPEAAHEPRRSYRKPPPDLPGPSGYPTRSSAVHRRHLRGQWGASQGVSSTDVA